MSHFSISPAKYSNIHASPSCAGLARVTLAICFESHHLAFLPLLHYQHGSTPRDFILSNRWNRPAPTSTAFLAAAARRTAKTEEFRKECERRREEVKQKQIQKEKALKEIDGVSMGIMRLLGLKRVREKGVRKGPSIDGGQVDKKGEASSGGVDAGKDAGGTSKEELTKDAASSKEEDKEAVENDTV
ncbi:hypothetical protein V493_08670 [Pseudogymnoascus sp. VKM F-4281 (FW-2241)]|nr:hypothetical protein V493_08670 [Pseudogymnoascus sp. VKM F-4281 (FW-2241)]